MVWSLQMWAMGEGIDIQMLKVGEAGGEESGVGMFAIILVAAQKGLSGLPLENLLLEDGTTWAEIMQTTMEQRPEEGMAPLDVWVENLCNDVMMRWMVNEVEKEDQFIQLGFLERYFKSFDFSFVDHR